MDDRELRQKKVAVSIPLRFASLLPWHDKPAKIDPHDPRNAVFVMRVMEWRIAVRDAYKFVNDIENTLSRVCETIEMKEDGNEQERQRQE